MLHVGQRIIDGSDEWVVLELLSQKNHTPRVRIKVEKIGVHMKKFLTLGKEYVLRQANQLQPDHFVWVVPEKQCKATSSQVLLYDWPSGPSMDIDT
jgi:hypothetical protein